MKFIIFIFILRAEYHWKEDAAPRESGLRSFILEGVLLQNLCLQNLLLYLYMKWNIILCETERGEKPVEDFIKSLQSKTIAKVSHHINLLEKHGAFLGMPHAKKITNNLYELRVRGKQEIRIIYGFVKRDIYLLHAFKKQTRKTPHKEIKTALLRFHHLT